MKKILSFFTNIYKKIFGKNKQKQNPGAKILSDLKEKIEKKSSEPFDQAIVYYDNGETKKLNVDGMIKEMNNPASEFGRDLSRSTQQFAFTLEITEREKAVEIFGDLINIIQSAQQDSSWYILPIKNEKGKIEPVNLNEILKKMKDPASEFGRNFSKTVLEHPFFKKLDELRDYYKGVVYSN